MSLVSDFPPDGLLLARLVARKLRRKLPRQIDADDILSGCCEGVLRAWRSHDPTKMPWSMWACLCAKRAAIDLVRNILGRKSQKVHARTANLRDLASLATCPRQAPFQVEDERRSFERRIAPLRPRHRMAMRLLYLDNLTRREAARVMGCSESLISYWHADIREILAKEMSREGQ